MAVNPFAECQDLLLPMPPDDERLRELLAPVGFTDWRAAAERLRQLVGHLRPQETFALCLPQLLMALSSAANPDRVLVNLERLTHAVNSRLPMSRDCWIR